ncbi:MAG: hypothetical protein ACR2NN_25250 [Bryobacteraceae bacterium]
MSNQHRLAFPLLILLIVAGFYWKLTLTKQYTWLGGPDIATQVLPWFEEEARQAQHHMFPLWDSHNWLGAPLLGQAQPGAAYPLNWLLFLIPETHGHIRPIALQWYFIAIHYMAALFCYLLCRDLGCSRVASLVGGLIFSLAAYVGTSDWPQMVNGAVWAPLVLLFLLRSLSPSQPALRAIANAALSGACLGIAWLSGHHQVPVFITLTAGGVWLYYILRDGHIHWTVLLRAAVMAVFMVLVGALQTIPAQEYGHLAMRWVSAAEPVGWSDPVPYLVHKNFSLTLISLFAIVFPGMNHHADPYIGVVALGFALLGIALCWRLHAVKLFAAIAMGGLAYSLGQNSVFQGLLYGLLPLVDKARVPSMAVVVFGLGAAVLAAFGVESFALQSDSIWERRIGNGLLGFALLTFILFLGTLFMQKLSWDAEDRVLIAPFVALLLAALLYAWRTGNLDRRQAAPLLILLLLLELGNNSGYAFADRSEPKTQVFLNQVRGNGDLAEFLHKQPGPFRVEMATDAISPNWGEYHNFDVVLANGASVATNVFALEWHTWQARFLLGVRYTLGGDKPPFGDSREMYQGTSGIKVFENPSVFPRAWAVHEIIPVKKLSDGMDILRDHLDDLRHKAFSLKNIPAIPACSAPDDVSIPSYKSEVVTIRANMGCDGMVVISDAFFPGWGARVDGKPAEIYEVDGPLRGVLVPQGSHQLTMRYRPASVYLGAALTLLGIAGTAVLTTLARYRATTVRE